MGLEALSALGRVAAGNARLIAGVFVCACALLLSGCASLWPQTAELRKGLPPDLPPRVELTYVPFFPQSDYQCGPAALATELVALGVRTTPDDLVPQVYLPERKGSLQIEMLAAARRHGLVSYQLAPRLDDVLREIAAGTPVILLQNLGLVDGWHYAVAIGYDYDSGNLILRSGTTERQVLPFTMNEFVWRRSGYWAMVTMPPNRMPATVNETRWLGALAAFERGADPRASRLAYETFLKRWPADVNARIGLANAYYALHELPEAERVLREAEQQAPDSVIVLNNLAQTLSDQGRNREALALIERAAAQGGPFAAAVQETRATIRKRLAATN